MATASSTDEDRIYADNNATTPLHPEVALALSAAWESHSANPSSLHREGQQAAKLLERCRHAVASQLNARVGGPTDQADQVIFTSGGTESNNLALHGLAARRPGRIVTSSLEHPSVLAACQRLEREGRSLARVGVTPEGQIDLWELRQQLAQGDVGLVAIMLANHETGVVQPVDEVAAMAHAHGALVHVDAVQAVGKLPVDFQRLKADSCSFTAHKFHGPRGIGGLIVRAGTPLEPLLVGGFQQYGLRAGTESLELIVGMCRALEVWSKERVRRQTDLATLRGAFEAGLRDAIDGLVIHGEAIQRTPQTSCFSLPGVDRQAMLMALDLAGLACSSGSACASGSTEDSPVLRAMGCNAEQLGSALRVSFGALNAASDGSRAAERIIRTYHQLRRGRGVPKSAATSRVWGPEPI